MSAAGVVQVNGDEPLCPQPAKLKKLGGSGSDRFNTVLANMVVDTLWTPPGMDPEFRQQRRTAALRGFGPRDEVEGMTAAQAVALHHAAMECLRRAMIPDQPVEAAAKQRRDAANLSRAAVDMAEAIDRRRGKGPQAVRVERVVVQDGGQAIVGAVAATPATAQEGVGREPETGGGPHAPRAAQKREQAGRSDHSAPVRGADQDR